MPGLDELTIACPSCGEPVSILVDTSVPEQEYTEDCQVCCRPIVLDVLATPAGDVTVRARREDD